MKQILIVEDDSFLNKMVAYNLTADGLWRDFCPKCQNRSRRHPPAEFNLVPGHHLPDGNGAELCS